MVKVTVSHVTEVSFEFSLHFNLMYYIQAWRITEKIEKTLEANIYVFDGLRATNEKISFFKHSTMKQKQQVI